MTLVSPGDRPPATNPRALEGSTALLATFTYLCSVVPDGGTKYPCVSNLVTPSNCVPYVKSLVSPGVTDVTATSLTAVRVNPLPTNALSTAVTESGLLHASNTVPGTTFSA